MRLLPVVDAGWRVLAAVSGGPDSVALLLLLNDMRCAGEIELCAAHLNHGIRGAEADGDEAFVRELCQRLNVQLYCERINVPALAAKSGRGLETCAREARRGFLEKAKTEARCDVIATAHHMDDQAETVLMHLLRGCGLKGAGGMRPSDGSVIRPLLGCGKEEILLFLAERGQEYRFDSTNAVADNPRNSLRLDVMPRLIGIYPGASRAISRFACVARDEDAYMDAAAREWMRGNVFVTKYGYVMVANADIAIMRRAVVRLTRVGFDAASRAVEVIKGARTVEIPGWRVELTSGEAHFIRSDFAPAPDEVPLADGARLDGVGRVRIRSVDPGDISRDPWSQTLDCDALEGAVIRTRRPGDTMRPFGAPGTRKLKDILIDQKIARPQRDAAPVVAKGGRILWIPGVCISQEASIGANTRCAKRLDWEREDRLPWREDR